MIFIRSVSYQKMARRPGKKCFFSNAYTVTKTGAFDSSFKIYLVKYSIFNVV